MAGLACKPGKRTGEHARGQWLTYRSILNVARADGVAAEGGVGQTCVSSMQRMCAFDVAIFGVCVEEFASWLHSKSSSSCAREAWKERPNAPSSCRNRLRRCLGIVKQATLFVRSEAEESSLQFASSLAICAAVVVPPSNCFKQPVCCGAPFNLTRWAASSCSAETRISA